MTGRARGWLVLAALVGTVHAIFSLYWAIGGDWLLETLGERIVTTFADMRWVLVPVGLVKLVAALAPLGLDRRGWPLRPLTRGLAWLGAAVLVVWGGLNTLVGQLVLAGAIQPDGGYDRPGMIGHAWLWDPLFLLWGLALLVHLVVTRRRRG
ncbi:hypothetical protein AWH69_04085 [Janibacter melonis]|uniref:DUF3995 domain-containing protein n=1 Tax=Janibacter melonis TaxID=262209 RepID=A0A176QH05_9MICO|nr:DUF3995 domain-containing protein [Janibacter melonis]OAB88951.1 hypothetical protein AWH69_04085 [Janibacter melonis]